MRNALLGIAVVCFFAPRSIAAEPAKPAAPVAHASPEAVYKVYREACLKRDWRTVWNCLTVEKQKYELFECYFASETNPDMPPLLATLKKHGVESDKVGAEITKALAAYEQQHRLKLDPTSPNYTLLCYEVLFKLVADKPGFYDEMCNHLIEPGPMKIHELKKVTQQGKTATGESTTTMTHYEVKPGQPERKIERIVPKEIRFAKVNGGWLLAP